LNTYNDVYLSVRKALRGIGVESFTLESRILCAYAAEKTMDEFMRDLKLYISEEYQEKVQGMLKRRLKGEPLAYIVGEWEFYGLPFSVNPSVLIPRVDTEIMVDQAINMLRYRMNSKRVLDLCAGSGCIGISVAVHVRDSSVLLVDSSDKALEVCRRNILRTNSSHHVTAVNADATKAPPALLGTFDMILCNPPYIPTKEIRLLDKSVADYEPREALDGGKDGLDFYRSITSLWKAALKPGAVLMFECGIDQAKSVREIMEEEGYTDIVVFKDTLKVDRVVAGTR